MQTLRTTQRFVPPPLSQFVVVHFLNSRASIAFELLCMRVVVTARLRNGVHGRRFQAGAHSPLYNQAINPSDGCARRRRQRQHRQQRRHRKTSTSLIGLRTHAAALVRPSMPGYVFIIDCVCELCARIERRRRVINKKCAPSNTRDARTAAERCQSSQAAHHVNAHYTTTIFFARREYI